MALEMPTAVNANADKNLQAIRAH
jgi:hypothetical protein